MRFVRNDLSCGASIGHRGVSKCARNSSTVQILSIALSLGLSLFDDSPAIAAAATAVSAKKYGIDYTCICCASSKFQKKKQGSTRTLIRGIFRATP